MLFQQISQFIHFYACKSIKLDTTFNLCVIHTVVGPPGPVNNTILNSNKCAQTYVTISWNPFTSDPLCGPVLYDVAISPSDGVVMMRITDTSYNLTGLQFGTNYTVAVVGSNNGGVGESSVITFYKPTIEQSVPSGKV